MRAAIVVAGTQPTECGPAPNSHVCVETVSGHGRGALDVEPHRRRLGQAKADARVVAHVVVVRRDGREQGVVAGEGLRVARDPEVGERRRGAVEPEPRAVDRPAVGDQHDLVGAVAARAGRRGSRPS